MGGRGASSGNASFFQSAIEDYVSGDMMWVSNYLRGRGDFGNLSKDEKEYIDTLKKATDAELKPTTLYRSVDASAIFGNISNMEYESLIDGLVYGDKSKDVLRIKEKFTKRVIGREIVEKGFMSTTKDYEIAKEFGGFTGSDKPIVMEVKTNRGTKGIDVMENASSQMKITEKADPQKEVLLRSGQRYKIESVASKEGQIYVKVKMKGR